MLSVLIRIASWVNSTYNHCVENRKHVPKLPLFASWTGAMINPQWFELPMSRTNFHGPKDVRAIDVRLYLNLGVKLHIHSVKCGCSINCFPQFRKSDMSKYGYLEVFHRVAWISKKRGSTVFRPAITKTYLYNFDPLKPHFYIVKLGFTGVYIIFLISAQNIDCGYSLEPLRRDGSFEYPQSMFWAEI